MKNLRPVRRPSAAMIVAGTALVSSFAGPAVADEVARVAQSITNSGQIKNGTVTGADIKNNSVTATDLLNGSVQSEDIGTGQVQTSDLGNDAVRGDKIQSNSLNSSDIQDETITGDDVNESLLGKVASAGRADTAGSATRADVADSTSDTRRFFFRMQGGESRQILKHGNITLTARCIDNATIDGSANQDGVQIITSVSSGGAYQVADSEDGDYHDTEGDEITPATPAEDSVLYGFDVNNDTSELSADIDALNVLGTDNTSITSPGGEGIQAALNLNDTPCIIGGRFYITN